MHGAIRLTALISSVNFNEPNRVVQRPSGQVSRKRLLWIFRKQRRGQKCTFFPEIVS